MDAISCWHFFNKIKWLSYLMNFILNLLSMQANHVIEVEELLPEIEATKKAYYGFNGRVFPLLGSIIGMVSILWTYYVAAYKQHPDVDKFPWTDITHTAIHFPEYVIFRIGMMVCPVVLCITFQILKNYIEITCFDLTGRQETRVNKFGKLSVFACLALCASTASISDGGDMNWTLHTIGATSFFLISLYMTAVASAIYRELWMVKHFIPWGSYQIKKYTNHFLGVFIVLQILQGLKVIDWGSFVEWAAAFFLMFYFFTLYWDFKKMDIMLIRK